uniref:Cytochrome b5 heme-binding domain-containing protein n=1 Tax=Phaeomonas parva TaxID=124430 RepID=A0A7S1UFE8_9STRA|mmetsp:Transcript_45272/g.141917  ORF Transcript_45272/g.141917 Transcript_45272/m.141917 type:complete len:440 (+) Transcript_45272:242-1561(+)
MDESVAHMVELWRFAKACGRVLYPSRKVAGAYAFVSILLYFGAQRQQQQQPQMQEPLPKPILPALLSAAALRLTSGEAVCLVGFMLLVGITIYRKQLSANRVYFGKALRRRSQRRAGPAAPSATNATAPVSTAKPKPKPPLVLAEGRSPASSFSESDGADGSGSDGKTDLANPRHGEGMSKLLLSERRVDFLQALPPDAAVQVLRFAGMEGCIAASGTSRGVRDVVEAGEVWAALWRDRWSDAAASPFFAHAVARDGLQLAAGGGEGVLQRLHELTFLAKSMRRRRARDAYFIWELSWRDWVLAGADTEATCFISIHDAVVDMTAFLPQHPGSMDTVLDNAAADATAIFDAVGHSRSAKRLLRALPTLRMRRQRVPARLAAAHAAKKNDLQTEGSMLDIAMLEPAPPQTLEYREPYSGEWRFRGDDSTVWYRLASQQQS